MAAPKGKPRPPSAGRKKGTPNKATQNAREAIASFVDGNAHRLEGWLDKIAEKDPKEAFICFQSVIEYHIPKLARSDSTVEHKGGMSITKIERVIVDPANKHS